MRRSVEASVEIEAQVETVYGYWQTFENLSQFMVNIDALLTEVRERSHWTLNGSYHALVEFNALTTREEENRAVGMETAEAQVGPSGQVSFEEVELDRTRVEMAIDYTVPRRHEPHEASARAAGDPQLMLDRYLESLKSILEGRTTPGELRNRPPTATDRSELAALFAGGVIGSALLTGLVLLLVSRAAYKRKAPARTSGKKYRVPPLPTVTGARGARPNSSSR